MNYSKFKWCAFYNSLLKPIYDVVFAYTAATWFADAVTVKLNMAILFLIVVRAMAVAALLNAFALAVNVLAAPEINVGDGESAIGAGSGIFIATLVPAPPE